MQLIPYTVGQVKLWRRLPLVLSEEMIMGGLTIIVFLYDVIEGLIG
jgi:hypothetical protein